VANRAVGCERVQIALMPVHCHVTLVLVLLVHFWASLNAAIAVLRNIASDVDKPILARAAVNCAIEA